MVGRRADVWVWSLMVVWAVLGFGTSQAATYYVARDGNDASGDGTSGRPYRTIAKGASVLTPGDTLLIRSGTYEERLGSTLPPGAGWQKPVTVRASPGDQVIVQPKGSGSVLSLADRQSYIVFEGLVFDAGKLAEEADGVTIGDGADHIRLQNCEIRNAGHSGVRVEATCGPADGNEFINCHIHDNGKAGGYCGVHIATSGNLVEGGTIHHNGGHGVLLYRQWGDRTYIRGNVIRGNSVYENAGCGIDLAVGYGNAAYNNVAWGNKGGGIHARNAREAKILNNTIYGNGGTGVVLMEDNKDCEVRNNIIVGNEVALEIYTGSPTTVSHNLLAGPRLLLMAFPLGGDAGAAEAELAQRAWYHRRVHLGETAGKEEAGNGVAPGLLSHGDLKLTDNLWTKRFSDPLFVNPEAHDFHLRAGSPAIDTGMALDLVTKDRDGTARPQGKAPDMGAFEFKQK